MMLGLTEIGGGSPRKVCKNLDCGSADAGELLFRLSFLRTAYSTPSATICNPRLSSLAPGVHETCSRLDICLRATFDQHTRQMTPTVECEKAKARPSEGILEPSHLHPTVSQDSSFPHRLPPPDLDSFLLPFSPARNKLPQLCLCLPLSSPPLLFALAVFPGLKLAPAYFQARCQGPLLQ
eukprot:1558515-Rhodomonas_salina.2